MSDRESIQVNRGLAYGLISTRNRLSNWRNRNRCYRTLDRENRRTVVAAKGQLTAANAVGIGACCKPVLTLREGTRVRIPGKRFDCRTGLAHRRRV